MLELGEGWIEEVKERSAEEGEGADRMRVVTADTAAATAPRQGEEEEVVSRDTSSSKKEQGHAGRSCHWLEGSAILSCKFTRPWQAISLPYECWSHSSPIASRWSLPGL